MAVRSPSIGLQFAFNLRDSVGKLAIPLPRTNYYKHSFGYSGAVLSNSLPSAARQATGSD